MAIPTSSVCPLRKKYGDIICIDGSLWALTYSECAPPDQRQYWGECSYCKHSDDRTAAGTHANPS